MTVLTFLQAWQFAVLLLEQRDLDDELGVKDDPVLVVEVVLIPRPGVDLGGAAEEADQGVARLVHPGSDQPVEDG